MSQRGGPPKKKEAPFYAPFSGLKELQKKKEAPPTKAAPARPPPPTPARRARAEEDDEALFRAAMDGVQQLAERGREPPPPDPRLPQLVDENAEALAQLAELVAGQGSFDIAGSDALIEGAAPGTDRSLLRALREGAFSVQARLDLHGMTQPEARDAVERFLAESRRAGKRCVLVVHGRGLNSKDQVPVLKEQLRGWLSQKRIGKGVLAFASARPQDGGAGALYVLLRR